MRQFVPFLFLLPLFAAWIWLSIWSRRKRRFYRDHPEEQPYGSRLLIRGAPFAGICGAAVIYGFVARDAYWAVLGVVGVCSFAWNIRKRWNPPT